MNDANKYAKFNAELMVEKPEKSPLKLTHEMVRVTCTECGNTYETTIAVGWKSPQRIWCHGIAESVDHTIERI